MAKDIAGGKLLKANKVAKKRLAEAKKYMNSGDENKFHDAVLLAMWGYLGDKLGLPASSLTRENIAAELGKYGAAETLTGNIIKVLDDCEMAKYSPSNLRPSMQSVYEEAASAIHEMENLKITKKK